MYIHYSNTHALKCSLSKCGCFCFNTRNVITSNIYELYLPQQINLCYLIKYHFCAETVVVLVAVSVVSVVAVVAV